MEDEREEMLRVAKLALRVRMFLYYTASSYAFFVYALSVISLALIGAYIDEKTGRTGVYTSTFSVIGLLLASTLFIWILRKVARAVGEEAVQTSGARGAIKATLLLVVAPVLAAFLVGFIYPPAAAHSWYPALGLFLVALYIQSGRQPHMRPHLLAGTIIILTSPPALYAMSTKLTVGLMGLSYLIAGAYAAHLGLNEIEIRSE